MPDPASFVSITRLVDTRRSIESRKNIESAIYQTRYVHWRASSTLEISSSRVKRMETIERERKGEIDQSKFPDFSPIDPPNARRHWSVSWLITSISPPFVFARIVPIPSCLRRPHARHPGRQKDRSNSSLFFIFVIRADDRSIAGSLSTLYEGVDHPHLGRVVYKL